MKRTKAGLIHHRLAHPETEFETKKKNENTTAKKEGRRKERYVSSGLVESTAFDEKTMGWR